MKSITNSAVWESTGSQHIVTKWRERKENLSSTTSKATKICWGTDKPSFPRPLQQQRDRPPKKNPATMHKTTYPPNTQSTSSTHLRRIRAPRHLKKWNFTPIFQRATVVVDKTTVTNEIGGRKPVFRTSGAVNLKQKRIAEFTQNLCWTNWPGR